MLGRNHATMGLLVAEGIALTAHLPLHDVVPMVVGVGAGSLWPDIDEKESKISFSLVPVSTAVSAIMSRITGGHRRATHSPIGIAVTAGLALATLRFFPRVGLVLCVAAVYILLRSVIPTLVRWLFVGGSLGILLIAGVAGMLLFDAHDSTAIVWWFALGSMVHLVGDVITAGGIPLLWPLSDKPVAVSHLRVGSPTERIIGLLMSAVLIISVFTVLHGMSLKTPNTTSLVTQAHNTVMQRGNVLLSSMISRVHLAIASLFQHAKKY